MPDRDLSRRRTRRPRAAASAIACAVVGAGMAVTITAPAGAAAPAPATPTIDRTSTVQLPTGERVEVNYTGTRARIVQRTGSPAIQVLRAGGHTYLLPREALAHIGRLDLALFDLAHLATTPRRIPVTVQGRATAVPGVTITSRSGPSAHGYITASSAPKLGKALRDRAALPGVIRLGLDVPTAATPNYPQVTLDIKVKSPTGVTPDGTVIAVVNTDDSRRFDQFYGLDGNERKVSLPKGHYSLIAYTFVLTPDGNGATVRFAFAPDLTVSQNDQRTVLSTVGATRNALATFHTPRPSTASYRDQFYVIVDDRGVVGTSIENPMFDDSVRFLAPAAVGGTHGRLTSIDLAELVGPAQDTVPYSYDLTHVVRNAVVPDLQLKVAPASLATVRSYYYTDGRKVDLYGGRFPIFPYFDAGELIFGDLPDTTGAHLEYVNNPPGVTWLTNRNQMSYDHSAIRAITGLARAYPLGAEFREDYFRGPLAPNMISEPGYGMPDCQACRSADQLLLGVPNFSDSEPLHDGVLFSTDPPELKLLVREDGRPIYASNEIVYGLNAAVVDVPSGDHGYDIVATHDGTVTDQLNSTHSRTEWTFRSSATSGASAPASWTCGAPGRAGCTVLPVLTIFDPLPTTLGGDLPAGQTQVVVTVAPVAGADVAPAGLTYAIGVDGRGYVAQQVRALGGGRYLVTIRTPHVAAGTSIDVHLHAIDTSGGAIDQTVQAAYTVAGS